MSRPARRPWPAGLLLAYPPDWRARYGEELELLVRDLRDHGRRPLPMAADLIRGAAAAWFTTRRGSAMSERSRGALITVLWSWVAFAATAFWFGHDLGRISQQPVVSQVGIATVPGIATSIHAQVAGAVPGAVPDAYHVLFAAGIVGVAATAVAAVAFAIGAARDARARQRWSVFALMATPIVVAAAWIGGIRLLPGASSSAGPMTASVLWLLLGIAGIAASTQAVVTVVRSTEFSPRTWRIGAVAATAITAAMLVATGATIVWGIAFRTSQAHPSDASGWLTVMAIMAVTTARAVLALIGARRAAAPVQPAVA